MATFNGSEYVREQLESILIQLSTDDELIVSDDSSSDQTRNIIESLSDHRIKLLDIANFRSPIKNFENAILHANGDFIFLADQDDVWLEEKLRITLEALRFSDLVISDCRVVDKHLNTLHESLFQVRGSKPGLINNLYRNSYTGCCMAFNRKVLKLALPFPENIPMHDWWIGLVAEMFGNVCFLDQPLLLYRRHENNASLTSKKSSFSRIKQISFRLNLIQALVVRAYSKIKMFEKSDKK